MGPYCKYCGQRCFVPITDRWPKEVVRAYRRGADIVATCAAGQAAEKRLFGVSWDDAKNRLQKVQA